MTLDRKNLKLIKQDLKVPLYDGVECRLALYRDRFIFKTGGCVGDEVFKDVEYFDTASDSDWVSCPQMNVGRTSHGTCCIANRLYVYGGYNPDDECY